MFGKLIHISPNNNLMINIFEIYWKSLDLSGMTFLSVSVYIFESEKQWASWNSLCSVYNLPGRLSSKASASSERLHDLVCTRDTPPPLLISYNRPTTRKQNHKISHFIKIFSEIKKLMQIRKSLHSLNSYLL